jgi:hypothetical protein
LNRLLELQVTSIWATRLAVVLSCSVCFVEIVEGDHLPPKVLLIGSAVESNTSEMRSIVDGVAAQLVDLGVVLEMKESAFLPEDEVRREEAAKGYFNAENLVAVLWCTADGDMYRAYIYLRKPTGDSDMSVRSIEIATAEGTGETLAVILRASVMALREAESDEEPSKSNVKNQDSLREERHDSVQNGVRNRATITHTAGLPVGSMKLLTLDAAYILSVPSQKWHLIHGAHLGLALKIFAFARLYISYCVAAPLRIANSDIRLRIVPHPVGLGVVFFLHHRIVEPRFRMGLGIDYATLSYTVRDDSLTSDDQTGYIQISLVSALELGIDLADLFKIVAGFGMNVHMTRPRYDLTFSETPRTVFEPWPVQPFATIGVSLGFF